MRRNKLLIVVLSMPFMSLNACSKKKAKSTEDTATPVAATTSTTAATTSTAKYAPKSAPATLSLKLPATLGGKKKKLGLALADSTPSAAGDTSQSQGYSQLSAQTAGLNIILAQLVYDVYLYDSISATVEGDCTTAQGADWTTCEKTDAQATFTQEMYNAVIDAGGGDSVLDPGEVASYKDQIGQLVDIADLIVTKPANDADGMVKCIDYGIDADNTDKVCWNTDFTKIQANSTFKDTQVDPTGAKYDESGLYKLTFDTAKSLMTATVEDAQGDSTFSSTFTLQPDKSSTKANAVVFTGSIKGKEPQVGAWGLDISGQANDGGGYAETTYSWHQPMVTAATASDVTTQGAIYALVPKDVTAMTDWSLALGSASGSGTSDLSVGLDYWGPTTVPTGMKLWTFAEGADGAGSFTDSTLTMATLTMTDSVEHLYYKEQWGSDGTLTYWCAEDTKGGACVNGAGTAGDDATQYASDTSADGGSLTFAGAATVTITGPTEVDLKGEDFIIVRSGTDMSTITPDNTDAWQAVTVAYGVFGGDPAALTAANGLNNYTITASGSADDINAGAVYRSDYDANGKAVFTAVSNAVISAQ